MSIISPSAMNPAGLGSPQAEIAFYVANRPPLPGYSDMIGYRPLREGELQHIVDHTSNHWRKLFNVYAKFYYALQQARFSQVEPDRVAPGQVEPGPESWQQLRDQQLLQRQGRQALMFTPPDFSVNRVHIVAGKTWAKHLGLCERVQWLDDSFAIHPPLRLIICPYLDYRQLSNVKISRLVALVLSLAPCHE